MFEHQDADLHMDIHGAVSDLKIRSVVCESFSSTSTFSTTGTWAERYICERTGSQQSINRCLAVGTLQCGLAAILIQSCRLVTV